MSKNFEKTLNEIKNSTWEEIREVHDWEHDAERLHLEQCISTGYRHKRLSNFTDRELEALADAKFKRMMQLYDEQK